MSACKIYALGVGLLRRLSSLAPSAIAFDNRAEVDFILQLGSDIIPIEVKADENGTGKSLTLYRKEFMPHASIRYSGLMVKKRPATKSLSPKFGR